MNVHDLIQKIKNLGFDVDSDKFINDPIYFISQLMLAEEKKLRTQFEIYQELSELQLKYDQQTFKETFGDFDGDKMDEPIDYYRWKELEEEMFLKALSDQRSRLSSAEEKGMLKVAKSFRDSGMPIQEFAKYTPYSAEELGKLLEHK